MDDADNSEGDTDDEVIHRRVSTRISYVVALSSFTTDLYM